MRNPSAAPLRLVAEHLDGESFAPFGSILQPQPGSSRSVNESRGRRFDLTRFLPAGGHVVLARYDIEATSWPVAVALLERHPGSPQAFAALDGAEALVVAAPSCADGEPDLGAARAFVAEADTPFLYAPGIWHAPLFALGRPGRFLMAMREIGCDADCETRAIDPPLLVAPVKG